MFGKLRRYVQRGEANIDGHFVRHADGTDAKPFRFAHPDPEPHVFHTAHDQVDEANAEDQCKSDKAKDKAKSEKAKATRPRALSDLHWSSAFASSTWSCSSLATISLIMPRTC